MQFGLFMMPLHPPYRDFADAYERDLDQLVLADRLGFQEAWVGEHITERWENAPAPDLLLARALDKTEHIKLGTGVTLLALHNPVYLAHRLAMLRRFFQDYKTLEGKAVEVDEFQPSAAALPIIEDALERYSAQRRRGF